jgi:hypothetical protein
VGNAMLSLLGKVSDSKWAIITISIVVILTVVDSEFIKLFYGTDLDSPGSFHLSLFLMFIIITSIINIACLRFVRNNDIEARISRPVVFRIAYSGTFMIQYGILAILVLTTVEILVLQGYEKFFILLVVYLSHFWSAIMLAVLSFTFVQWYKFTRSFPMATYGVVFTVVLFLILTTVPLLTEQFSLQTSLIYSRSYTNLILDTIVPSNNIAFIFGLGNYVLPVMIISSWILTVSLLKVYAYRIGRTKFWLLVSIPLLFQLFSFIVRNPDLVTDPNMVQIIYSKQFQFILGIGYQASGLLFAIGFWIIGMKMKRKRLRAYLMISAIGIASLFSSMQPGMPFYAAYPPFGLVTLMFLGLSSYILLVGILGSAAYISNDSELRREIFKGLDADSDVLKRMGSAEMQREIERRVLPLADKVKMSTEIEYTNLDMNREDLKMLIEDVLNEVHRGTHSKRDNH